MPQSPTSMAVHEQSIDVSPSKSLRVQSCDESNSRLSFATSSVSFSRAFCDRETSRRRCTSSHEGHGRIVPDEQHRRFSSSGVRKADTFYVGSVPMVEVLECERRKAWSKVKVESRGAAVAGSSSAHPAHSFLPRLALTHIIHLAIFVSFNAENHHPFPMCPCSGKASRRRCHTLAEPASTDPPVAGPGSRRCH